jgi:beta-glucosidase
MELKGFQRIRLAPGETREVSLPITPSALQLYDREMNRVVEPGEFEIMVGSSSQSHKSTTLTVVE